jgi:hypothetical protein
VIAGKVEFFVKRSYQFVFKQEKMTQLVLGICWLMVSIFMPPLVFLMVGLYGGKSLYHLAAEMSNR